MRSFSALDLTFRRFLYEVATYRRMVRQVEFDVCELAPAYSRGQARNLASADKVAYCVKAAVISPDRIHLSEAALFAWAIALPPATPSITSQQTKPVTRRPRCGR